MKTLASGLAFLLFFAVASDASELSSGKVQQKALLALRNKPFKALAVIRGEADKRSHPSVFVLYHLPDHTVRLEPTRKDPNEQWYIIETLEGTYRVLPELKKAFFVRGRRVGTLFRALEGFLSESTPVSSIRLESLEKGGAKVYRLYAVAPLQGRPKLEVVIHGEDFLPRAIRLLLPGSKLSLSVELSEVEKIDPKAFPPSFFALPEGCVLFGPRGKQLLKEREAQVLRNLERRLKLRQEAGQLGTHMATESDKDEEFVPVLPTYLPGDFSLLSIEPLFFHGALVFHLKATDPRSARLISIFQTRNASLLLQQKPSPRTDHMAFFLYQKPDGIFSLLVSSDVDEEELSKIANSLKENPEKAIELIEAGMLNLEEAIEPK